MSARDVSLHSQRFFMDNVTAVRAPAAAQYLGLSPSTLAKMRLRGDGPVFCKNGPRAVAYRISDLDDWLTSNRRSSTSDKGGGRTSKSSFVEDKNRRQQVGDDTA